MNEDQRSAATGAAPPAPASSTNPVADHLMAVRRDVEEMKSATDRMEDRLAAIHSEGIGHQGVIMGLGRSILFMDRRLGTIEKRLGDMEARLKELR